MEFISDRAMALPYFQTSWFTIRRIIYSANDSERLLSTEFRGRFGRLTGLFNQDEKFYLDAMQSAIDESDHPFPQCLSQYSTMYETAMEGHKRGYILGPGILNGLRNIFPKEAETVSRIHVTMAALAVERFRLAQAQLPESLNELVPQFLSAVPIDPFDGQPLRYHRLIKGYLIYSVGADGHDDGGCEKPANWKSTDKTSYDITFTIER
jgi:hypothetical protein